MLVGSDGHKTAVDQEAHPCCRFLHGAITVAPCLVIALHSRITNLHVYNPDIICNDMLPCDRRQMENPLFQWLHVTDSASESDRCAHGWGLLLEAQDASWGC